MLKNPISNDQKSKALGKMMNKYHTHNDLLSNQCSSSLVQKIDAPLPLVWSLVRRFDNPQAYNQFIHSCTVSAGDGLAGSVREILLVSGLPGERSTERLDRLDDDLHIMVISIIGGDQRLVNYQSTTTLHEDDDAGKGDQTVVIESYVVDVPPDSCQMDTCLFADTLIRCNLRSLSKITEKMAHQLPVAA
ncbi:hypothetical protein ACH5RR_015321 [Cinchona calisaya]|uniref:Uncharacterized protein n=1 Tax=Cinchona calisaya TaxID=153742 RepID=A0ABD2ZVH8_9GENT